MVRILISGASGFVGKPLSLFFSSLGHEVVSLSRTREPGSLFWNPEEGVAHRTDFEGFDAVIHLAGEPLTLTFWSQEKRKRILRSRVGSTLFLAHLLSSLSSPPKLFLSASAVGYYGDRGEEILTEESSPGTGFLARVCSSWEKASEQIQRGGARVVHARFGMVLGPEGGALAKMILPYRMGLGASLGSGKQWVSWIALDDLIRSIEHILNHNFLEGAINLVAPHPVRQKEFSLLLAHLLHRPHFFSLPAWLLRWRFGIVADEILLSSTRVQPTKLLASNFAFNYPDLRSALCKALPII